MAKFKFELAYEPRTAYGKSANRRIRQDDGKVPAVVYGADEQPESICLEQKAVNKALENEAVFSHILTLLSGNKSQKVVLKDIQRHPFKRRILHMDFLRISENKPIYMHIPLHFIGEKEAPGVEAGGTFTHHMVELEVKCLPRDLPEHIDIDVSKAELNTVVHLSQVPMPQGVELTSVVHGSEDDLPVISLALPKRIEEVEEVAPEAAEGAAAEVPATAEKKGASEKK